MGKIRKSELFSALLLCARFQGNSEVLAKQTGSKIDANEDSPSSGNENEPKWLNFIFLHFKSLESYFVSGCIVLYVVSFLVYYVIYRLSLTSCDEK